MIRLEDIGGREALAAIVHEFYERLLADAMIGFFFRDVDRARLEEKELELAARLFGDPAPYTGRPLRAAHARHHIFGGQFMRRLQILREVMEEHGLPAEAQAVWVEETLRLKDEITADAPGECRPPAPPAG